MLGLLSFGAFLATIPAANWLIGNFGEACIPDGPCLISVGFGLMAPSGVLMIGAALVLRDIVHNTLGPRWALVAILLGAALSWWIAPPYLVAASVAAFLVAELADFAVYQPLYKRRLALAVLASGVAGAVVDSAVFLWIAFGSLDFIAGQIVGKAYASIIAFAVISVMRRQRAA